MKLKYFCKWLGLAALMAWGVPAMAADRPSSTSAEFYKLHPEKYADQEIALEVCFIRIFDRKSPIPELRFFHAMTYDTKNNLPGGIMILAVPADTVDKMVKKYGSFPDGKRRWTLDSEKLKGTFRIGSRGRYYLDVSGEAAALLKGRDIPEEAEPALQGPGPGPRKMGN